MLIYLGADHRGFKLKERLKSALKKEGYEVGDMGAKAYEEGDDYPDFAAAVAGKISQTPDTSRGVLLCGSGAGVCVVANKFKHVRAALALSTDQIFSARHDDGINVICIASDFTEEDEAEKMVQTFIKTPFAGEDRFVRRLQKITLIETEQHAK